MVEKKSKEFSKLPIRVSRAWMWFVRLLNSCLIDVRMSLFKFWISCMVTGLTESESRELDLVVLLCAMSGQ